MALIDYVSNRCPAEKRLNCPQEYRLDEYERQLSEAFLCNRPVAFMTCNECPALMADCLRLRTYREKQKSK